MSIGGGLAGIIERFARLAAIAAIVLVSAVMIHQHTHQADSAPFIAVDDSLGNISVSMVEFGRNGFPASPFQGVKLERDPRRNEHQHNYGYAPFMLGAGLDWLFGTSYVSLRAIHVVGLVIAFVLATAVFWTSGLPGALLFAGVIGTIVWPNQWPMFRPDIGVALSGLAAIACATAALRSNSAIAWFATGFFASTTFGSHQVAWALVPWAGLMWLVAVALTEPGRRWSDVTIGPFIAVVAGGIVGILCYLQGMGWRIAELVDLWSLSYTALATATPLSYADILKEHLRYAWSSFQPTWLLLAMHAAIVAGLVATAVLWWRRSPLARPVAALAVPGALGALCYLLSLGAYRNHHTGYVILLQLSTVWAASAALAALCVAARSKLGDRADLPYALATLVGAGIVAAQAWHLDAAGTSMTAAVKRNVPFSEYEANVLAEVPQGASAFGDLLFGLRSGTRHQLVQTNDAMILLQNHGPSSLLDLVPEHLILREDIHSSMPLLIKGTVANSPAALRRRLLGSRSFLERSDVTYGETAIVYAEPYGETRVYTRDGVGRPSAKIYDSQWRQWLSRFEVASAHATEPAIVEMSLTGEQKRARSVAGFRLVVDPGIYLVEVKAAANDVGERFVTASTTPLIEVDSSSVNPIGTASIAPVLPRAPTQHVILRAPEGVGYIAAFGSPIASPLQIGRIERLVTNPPRTKPLAVPPLSEWKVMAAGGKLDVSADGKAASLTGVGIPVGYQLMSPPIAVSPFSEIIAHFDVSSSGPAVGLGFLDETEHWIAPPVRKGPLRITSKTSRTVRLLVTNFEPKAAAEPARFQLQWRGADVVQRYGKEHLYVDAIAKCWTPPGAAQSEACRK